jgi:hypothetical protein
VCYLGLGEKWDVFRYAWGCVLQFANGTRIVWEMRIDQSFLEYMKMFNFQTAVKRRSF